MEQKNIKTFLCRKCLILYLDKRPFTCSRCKSNVFIVEHKTTQKEISQIKANMAIKVVG